MIIIDAGHGFNTSGKCSPIWTDGTQLFEWEFNRDVAMRIQRELSQQGIKSVLLVEEAIDVYLHVRAERANKIAQDYPGSFGISIHANQAEKPNEGEGWEAYTFPGQTESDKLATCLYKSAEHYLRCFKLRKDYVDGDPDKEARFTILAKTSCPFVLTENLFYDNEWECKFMMSDYGKELITKLHVDAIFEYLKQ
jgi:N-acetylmuramoyl-L-alanine amidase